MENDPPEGLGKLGWTLGSATCLYGAVDGKRLFRVEPGNCVDRTLEQASILLACARRASFIGVMDNEPELMWASHYLGEMAKALMDDAHMGMKKNGGG